MTDDSQNAKESSMQKPGTATMSFYKDLKEISTFLLERLGLAWWAEVVTAQPDCTYYFGPFSSVKEAEFAQQGYIEDLEQESAQGIAVTIKRCRPKELTIFDDELTGSGISPAQTVGWRQRLDSD